jgi:flavodoxin
MKKLVIYYSYTGNTKKIAEDLASKESADLLQIQDKKRPGKFKVYTAGCFAAVKCKPWEIKPLEKDINEYDHIYVLAPVWANYPAPQINNIWNKLSSGKKITVKMVSASGKSSCKEKINELITKHGCEMTGFDDIKS